MGQHVLRYSDGMKGLAKSSHDRTAEGVGNAGIRFRWHHGARSHRIIGQRGRSNRVSVNGAPPGAHHRDRGVDS